MSASTDSPLAPVDYLAPGRIDRAVLFCALVAFLALLGTYVALVLTDHDASDLVRLFTQLAGTGVVGAAITSRITPRIARLERLAQSTKADTVQVKRQTNGELQTTVRKLAYDATTQALRDHMSKPENQEDATP